MEALPAVDRLTAEEEITKWLDHKQVGQKKRESRTEQYNTLVEAMMEGVLKMDDQYNFKLKLKFPIGADVKIPELNFPARIKVARLHEKLKGVDSDDGDGRILGYMAALTGQHKELLRDMDTVDYDSATAISFFFI